jgi:tRNA(fMet)-specific endonuclease VapC
MGKNDLWIAATASLLNLTFVTTDKDFNHLHNHFLNLRNINPEDLQSLIK